MNSLSNYSYNLGNISRIGKTKLTISCHNKTEIFKCKIKAKGLFSTLLNARFNLQILTGKYTLLDPNSSDPNISQVYVNVILKGALTVKSQISIRKINENHFSKTVRSCHDFIKTHLIKNETYIKIGDTDYSVYKSDSKIGVAQLVEGGFSTVINPTTTETATKLFRKSQNEYKTSQKKLRAILTKANPDNNAPGLQKLPIFTEKTKTITVYDCKGTATKVKGYVSTEDSYISDCVTINYKPHEVPSMCACLVQGSKTLLQNNIFHLDTKLENIGYLGKGKAEHFDLDGSANLNEQDWKNQNITHTPIYTPFSDFSEYFKEKKNENSNPDKAKELLTKIHIFQLGISFFKLVTNKSPISNRTFNGYANGTLDEATLKEALQASQLNINQQEIVLKMLSLDRNERPSIEEIEMAFPSSLIQKNS